MCSNKKDYFKKFRITVASLEEVIIQFYPHSTKKYWEFPLEVAFEVLQKAKEKFLN